MSQMQLLLIDKAFDQLKTINYRDICAPLMCVVGSVNCVFVCVNTDPICFLVDVVKDK